MFKTSYETSQNIQKQSKPNRTFMYSILHLFFTTQIQPVDLKLANSSFFPLFPHPPSLFIFPNVITLPSHSPQAPPKQAKKNASNLCVETTKLLLSIFNEAKSNGIFSVICYSLPTHFIKIISISI
jgi:hypothetical protein